MNQKVLFFLAVFIFTSAIGLYVGWSMIPEVGDISPVTGRAVDDPYNALVFLVWILVSTAILLLVLKYYKGLMLFRALELFMVFIGSEVVYSIILYDLIVSFSLPVGDLVYTTSVLLLAALTAVVRLWMRRRLLLNVTLAITVGGVAGLLGSTLDFLPAFLLVVGLSVYDAVAVFGTKHMVKLADQSRLRRLPVMFETSSKGIKTGPRKSSADGGEKPKKSAAADVLALGTGDIVIPVIFFVAILRNFDMLNLLGAYIGAMAGLAATIYYVTNIKRLALPALPPIMGASLIGFGISLLL